MLRLIVASLATTALLTSPALADEPTDANFAQYGVHIGGSPFGGSLNFNYNVSKKTSYFAVLGGLPGGEMELEVDATNYTVTTDSSWVGFFVHHRPFETADWFRFVAGVGIGSIENELVDADGNTFVALYKENPVGYIGIGFGAQPAKGFTYGFDLGWLQTAGPVVGQTSGTPDGDAVESITDHLFFGTALPNAQVTLGWGF
jgi:hypothetical protein